MATPRVILIVAALATAAAGAVVAVPAATAPLTRVVVLADASSATPHAATVVTANGGTVERRLDAIGGVVASVPADRISNLQAAPGIRGVSADRRVHLAADGFDSSADPGSLARTADSVGATTPAASAATGEGVDVALIDSGISPVTGLNAKYKIVNGPDISFDSQAKNKDPYVDNYGHGTHIAGIIAGNGGAKRDDFTGIAPDARLVNVKVADATGAVDVSQVIAGIDWVLQHRTDNGLNIRVINLSFGTDSSQSYVDDPLAFAAEVAWRNGIVVVSAAGNGGTDLGRLMDPADDPYLIAVGSDDANGTATTADDAISDFSESGDGVRNPDLVAPGRSIVSMRDPGSYIDSNYPGGRVTKRLFRGSGTSQATAVVSGVAADLLQQRPDLTPDQVKAVLMQTAQPIPNADVRAQGAGLVNLDAALAAPAPESAQAWTTSTGTGSLDAARGSLHLVHDGVALTGEQDIFGHPFDSSSMAGAEVAGSSWSGGVWNGSSWSGSSWSGSSWSGSSWSGSSWSGSSWSGSSWSGSSWSGSSWSGDSWGDDPQPTTTTCAKPKCSSSEDASNSRWDQ
jgi:subtilisin family serine protease